MTLANVTTAVERSPLREVIYGPDGIGKTTLAADAEMPIFIGPEKGTKRLAVARFPQPETWADVLEAVAVLERDQHPFRTVVVDTLDWLEPILIAHVLAVARCRNIEDVGGGFGKGHERARDGWRDFLGRLERLQEKRGMHIILLAHAQMETYKNPDGEDFDRWGLKLNKKASAIIREWAESVLFANLDLRAVKDEKTKRVRGISSGARWLYTTSTATYAAKNRYALPPRIPLSFDELWTRVQAAQSDDPESIRAGIRILIGLMPDALRGLAEESMKNAADDIRALAKVRNRIQARIEEAADAAELAAAVAEDEPMPDDAEAPGEPNMPPDGTPGNPADAREGGA